MSRSSPLRQSAPPRWLLLVCFLFIPALAQGDEISRADLSKSTEPKETSWLQKASKAEDRRAWLDACRFYEEALRKNKHNVTARDGYARSLRRLHLAARHNDAVYRRTLSRLKQDEALTTFEQVLQSLAYAYPDRNRTDISLLFQQGLQEARFALDDPEFRRHYLANVKPAVIDAFAATLAARTVSKMTRTTEARKQLWDLVRQAGKDGLPANGIFISALVMEFAAGACNALDDYSSFLTPGHLAGASARGKAGIGLEVGITNDRLKVTRVYPLSPAADEGIKQGDRIVRVGGQTVSGLSADAVADKFRGETGSSLDVEYERDEQTGPQLHTASLKRRAVSLPSVEAERRQHATDGIDYGYLRINYFSDDTLREVKEALGDLLKSGPIKGMILDLRGNPGGVFTSAVHVAELFLSGGVISIAQSPLPEYNGKFESGAPGALQFPVVVLIDGETASAAEVLAAAMKESRTSRTVLMGQTTFGKGSIQCLIQLKKAPLDKMAGIRLTVAKLLTPSSVPISGKGITPDKPLSPDVNADEAAHDCLIELIKQAEMLGAALAKM